MVYMLLCLTRRRIHLQCQHGFWAQTRSLEVRWFVMLVVRWFVIADKLQFDALCIHLQAFAQFATYIYIYICEFLCKLRLFDVEWCRKHLNVEHTEMGKILHGTVALSGACRTNARMYRISKSSNRLLLDVVQLATWYCHANLDLLLCNIWGYVKDGNPWQLSSWLMRDLFRPVQRMRFKATKSNSKHILDSVCRCFSVRKR